jgi:hypothetical protein
LTCGKLKSEFLKYNYFLVDLLWYYNNMKCFQDEKSQKVVVFIFNIMSFSILFGTKFISKEKKLDLWILGYKEVAYYKLFFK